MAKSKKARWRSRSQLPFEALPEHAQRHIRELGFSSAEAYLDWCREHGFPARWTNKSRRQLGDERKHVARQRAEASFARARRRTHRTGRVLRRVAARLVDGPGLAAASLGETGDLPIEVLRFFHDAERSAASKEFGAALLQRVGEVCPDLLMQRVRFGRDAKVISGVLALADFVGCVRRDVDSWTPRSKNPLRRFRALATHLFGAWPVPEFLDRAWFEESDLAVRARSWWVHVACGQNIRKAEGLPFVLTRRMAHAFADVPTDASLAEGLRYAEVLGQVGGDAPLAGALRGTRLVAEDAINEPFWNRLVAFLVRNRAELPLRQVGPILDYLYAIRFAELRAVDGQGRTRIEPPPEPEFSLEGRTVRSLLARTEEWHGTLYGSASAAFAWEPMEVAGYRDRSRDETTGMSAEVRIVELCNTEALRQEGARQRHCVLIYASSCRQGWTSIWSLSVRQVLANGERGPWHRSTTIEVARRSGRIVQARSRANRAPPRRDRVAIERWARQVGFRCESWIW